MLGVVKLHNFCGNCGLQRIVVVGEVGERVLLPRGCRQHRPIPIRSPQPEKYLKMQFKKLIVADMNFNFVKYLASDLSPVIMFLLGE